MLQVLHQIRTNTEVTTAHVQRIGFCWFARVLQRLRKHYILQAEFEDISSEMQLEVQLKKLEQLENDHRILQPLNRCQACMTRVYACLQRSLKPLQFRNGLVSMITVQGS